MTAWPVARRPSVVVAGRAVAAVSPVLTCRRVMARRVLVAPRRSVVVGGRVVRQVVAVSLARTCPPAMARAVLGLRRRLVAVGDPASAAVRSAPTSHLAKPRQVPVGPSRSAVVGGRVVRPVEAAWRDRKARPVMASRVVGGREVRRVVAVPGVRICRLVMAAPAAGRPLAVVGDRLAVAQICHRAAALSFPVARKRSAVVGGRVPLAGLRALTPPAVPGARKRSVVPDVRVHRLAVAM
jgi:hypothetical protein